MSPTATATSPERAGPVLERLKHLHPKVIDLSLDRVHRLLAALGDPHHRLPPVIHVAGTNGKGSTIAFLRAFLEAAGWAVHVYTSPHLVHFRERIRLAGRVITDGHLSDILEECERANRGQPITYFEVTTVAALLAFARAPADVVLLETGLGGRLDATNVIDRPAVTAITRISYDHMSFLGDTLTAIATEKAGIMKPAVPVVLAPQPAGEALDALLARAGSLGIRADLGGRDWRVEPTPAGFRFIRPPHGLDLPRPALAGAHQIVNAGVALACMEHLKPRVPVPPRALATGLTRVQWPARLQRLTQGPMVGRLPEGWELWLDGGHNDSAGEVLGVQAAAWQAEDGKPLDLIFGMLATKQPVDFLTPLVPFARRIRTVEIPGEEASLTAAEAASAAGAAGIADAEPAISPEQALDQFIAMAGGDSPRRVLVCGSLYLAGCVLSRHG